MTEIAEQLRQASQQRDWPTVESLARLWLGRQKFFVPHLFLIQALLQTNRPGEADHQFEDLMSYKFNLADRMNGFPELLERYRPRLEEHFIISTMRPKISFEGQALPVGAQRWNLKYTTETREAFLAEAEQLLDSAINIPSPPPKAGASVCTFGSCFAANLARMMGEQGLSASNLLVEESLNSTHANRILMEVVCGVGGGRAHEDMRREFGDAFFEKVRNKIRSSTHIVLTVGVAPGFFHVDDGQFAFAGNYRELLKSGRIRMRTTTCSENVENIGTMLSLMKRIAPAAVKIITVSPVPLMATTELPSVVLADCVSKSTLRAAVHEVVSADPEIIYFPAFEIVRWLSGYTKAEVYGADDQNSRHVSNWVVEFIVASFLRRFFAPGA